MHGDVIIALSITAQYWTDLEESIIEESLSYGRSTDRILCSSKHNDYNDYVTKWKM